MKKLTARIDHFGFGEDQCLFDYMEYAVLWLGSCEHCVGTIYRNSTNRAIYQIERGRVNFDRRMAKERGL